MIKLKNILLENKTKEELILSFIRELIEGTEFENKTFVAGGYVRDMVMGKKSKDIDITVALPQGGIKLANYLTKKTNSYKKNSNPVVYPTFGTAKFNFRNTSYKGEDISDVDIETVMTRKEQYKSKSRKPTVSFGTPNQDVERRDLTINSLLYDISNQKILDLTGKGISDIKNKIIRTPIDSNIIFKEDPLRMMRAVRFASKYGWDLSKELLSSIKKNSSWLENISNERIQEELNKILLSDHPSEGINYLVESNLMEYIIPEFIQLKKLKQNEYHEWDVYEHTLKVIDNTPKKLDLRLSALFHDIGKIKTKSEKDGKIQFLEHEKQSAFIASKTLKNLKYDNNIIKKVVSLVLHHMKTKQFGNEANMSDKYLRKLMHTMGEDIEDLLDLIHSDNISHGSKGWTHNMEDQVDNIREKIKRLGKVGKKLDMPVDGDRIMKLLGLKGGPIIGKIKNDFKEIFLEDPNKINNMSDSEIEDIIKNIYEKYKN